MAHIDLTTLGDHIGEALAVSEWIDITQARIDGFAEATDDRQWIHVDPARAELESPFKTTIAHGFLTLSLVSMLLRTAVTITARMAINYGVNRVRFVSVLPVGSRVRGHFSPAAFENVPGGIQVTWDVSIEREGHEKPCCVAAWIVRYYL
jgi:acyl dehydratase